MYVVSDSLFMTNFGGLIFINVKVFETKIFENKDFLDCIYSMKELS